MSKVTYEVVVKQIAYFTILAQIRQEATDEEDHQLTESIRQYGILQPLGVRPKGEKGERGELVWGHRRLRCAIAAGLKEVPAVILSQDMTEGEFLTLQMMENILRADLSQYDLWQGCIRLLEANKGWQLKDLAENLHRTPASITQIMSVSKLDLQWAEALRKRQVNISECYACSKLDKSKWAGLLALKLSGAGKETVEEHTRKPRSTEAPKLSRVKLQLSSKVNIVLTGKDLTIDSVYDAFIEASKEARKAREQGIDVKAFNAVMSSKSKAT